MFSIRKPLKVIINKQSNRLTKAPKKEMESSHLQRSNYWRFPCLTSLNQTRNFRFLIDFLLLPLKKSKNFHFKIPRDRDDHKKKSASRFDFETVSAKATAASMDQRKEL